MPKVYTFDNLIDALQADLAWRRKELKILNDRIPKEDTPFQHAALRSAVPLLYAHWEGYVKNAADAYLQFVSRRFLKHSELKTQFIALSLFKRRGKVEVRSLSEQTEAIEFLLQEYEKKANIPTKNVINTGYNLWYETLEEIMNVLGLDYKIVADKKDLIDDLVDARNNIAHGMYLRVDLLTYTILHEDIIKLMEAIKTEIENSAISEAYRKKE